jgi:hypothetical protein
MDGIKIYKSLSQPPKSALREIQAGKLKGKTDINPQWRYEAMTEKFGLVGCGWKYEIQNVWTEPGAGSEKLAFAQVAVYVKDGEKWSEPIIGIGGSKLVQVEKGAAVSNDEGYKMAVTDAFSTALKMLGVAADIYAGKWDGSKYKEPGESAPQKQPAQFNFTPKGGETTPEEKQELAEIFKATFPDGSPVFSKDAMKFFSDMRKDFTAREVIDRARKERDKRLNPTATMSKASELPPAVEAIKDAVDGEIVEGETAPGDLF